jgi:hypothetical protein
MKGNVRNEHTRVYSRVFDLPHRANLPCGILYECGGQGQGAPPASHRLYRVCLGYVRFWRPDMREAVPTHCAPRRAATCGVSGGMRSERMRAGQLLSSGLRSMLAVFAGISSRLSNRGKAAVQLCEGDCL